jgi:hypothetical protein
MPEWLEFAAVIAAFIALGRWVLPRFGVPS